MSIVRSCALLTFRLNKIGLPADITKMFIQVRSQLKGHMISSFLWHPGGGLDAPPDTHQLNAHPCRATSSAPFCTMFAPTRTAADNEQ